MHRSLILLTLLMLAWVGGAVADVPRTMSYQGQLADAAGNPVADGSYDLTFNLYHAATGGTAVYTETQPGVPVVGGGFSVLIGSVNPLAFPFDVPYWLGVRIGADPELTPRVPLASSPYAMSLALPYTGTAYAEGATFYVRNTGPGAALVADGALEVGSEDHSGRLRVRSSGPGIGHFEVDPDAGGTGDPVVTIASSLGAGVLFDMRYPGNDMVHLGVGTVSDVEILDEPGVASQLDTNLVSLTDNFAPLITRSLSVPAPGYALVIATAEANVQQSANDSPYAVFGVSEDAANPPGHQKVRVRIPAGSGGLHEFPVTVHGVFPVSAGTHSFHMVGKMGFQDSWYLENLTLTVLYVPTAYGVVTSAAESSGESAAAAAAPRTPVGLAEERAAAVAFDRARVDRELAEVRSQLQRIQQQIASGSSGAVAPK